MQADGPAHLGYFPIALWSRFDTLRLMTTSPQPSPPRTLSRNPPKAQPPAPPRREPPAQSSQDAEPGPQVAWTRRWEFDAAHRLMGTAGLCRHLHGHRYTIDVTIEEVAGEGAAVDFQPASDRIGDWLEQNADHAAILCAEDTRLIILGESEGWRLLVLDRDPTTGCLAQFFLRRCEEILADIPRLRVRTVRLQQSPSSWAEAKAAPASNP